MSTLHCYHPCWLGDHQHCAQTTIFDFPGCEGCPKALHTVRTVGSSEDLMKSMVWRGWIYGFSRKSIMESFIHRENLALFRKRLAEPQRGDD
jgi:hypothetical protein